MNSAEQFRHRIGCVYGDTDIEWARLDPAPAMVVAVVYHMLCLYDFYIESSSAQFPNLLLPECSSSSSSGSGSMETFPLIRMKHKYRQHFVTVRSVCVFDELHIHATSSTSSSDSSVPVQTRLSLILDPSVYLYSADLLSLNAFTVLNNKFTLRFHELCSRLTSSLFMPLFVASNVECACLTGVSTEIGLHILSYLSAPELLAVDITSKRLHLLASRDELWKRLGEADFAPQKIAKPRLYSNLMPVTSKKTFLKNAALFWERHRLIVERSNRGRSASSRINQGYWAEQPPPRFLFGPGRPFPALQPSHVLLDPSPPDNSFF